VKILFIFVISLISLSANAGNLPDCLSWYVAGSGDNLRISSRLSKLSGNLYEHREPFTGPCQEMANGLSYLRAEGSVVKEMRLIFFSKKLDIFHYLSSEDRLAIHKQFQKSNSATFYPVKILNNRAPFGYSVTKTAYGFEELIFFGSPIARD
jgi:hypothetical protein